MLLYHNCHQNKSLQNRKGVARGIYIDIQVYIYIYIYIWAHYDVTETKITKTKGVAKGGCRLANEIMQLVIYANRSTSFMCVYMYVCVCVYIYVYIHVYEFKHVHDFKFACIYIYIHVFESKLFIHICEYTNIHIYLHTLCICASFLCTYMYRRYICDPCHS